MGEERTFASWCFGSVVSIPGRGPTCYLMSCIRSLGEGSRLLAKCQREANLLIKKRILDDCTRFPPAWAVIAAIEQCLRRSYPLTFSLGAA